MKESPIEEMEVEQRIKKESFICHLSSKLYTGDISKIDRKRCIALSELKKIIMDNSDNENIFNEIIWAIEEIEKQEKTSP